MKKIKASFYILEVSSKTGKAKKRQANDLPVNQWVPIKKSDAGSYGKVIEAINKLLPKYQTCELDCYSPA